MGAACERIARNLAGVRERIARAAERAGRAPENVRLVAVTKTVGIEEVRILNDLGVTDFGENRPEVAAAKIEAFSVGGELFPAHKEGLRWHMIGPVQRRKIPDILDLFDRVDSVDRIEVGESLERRCAELGTVIPVLLEVNVSGETSKHGFTADDIQRALDVLAPLPHLHVQGLMTMAPFVDDPEEVRPVFARLRALAERLGLKEISMGMSNDFEVAIEEGATEVRIGTALFE